MADTYVPETLLDATDELRTKERIQQQVDAFRRQWIQPEQVAPAASPFTDDIKNALLAPFRSLAPKPEESAQPSTEAPQPTPQPMVQPAQDGMVQAPNFFGGDIADRLLAPFRQRAEEQRREEQAAAPAEFSGALTTLGGTPEAEALTRPGGIASTEPPTNDMRYGPIDHSSRDAFVRSMAPYAVEAEKATGIPASIMLAINLNEQGWQHDAPGNNYFGIKGSNPRTGANTGPVNTWEDYGKGRVNIQDTFRAYNSPAESYADFAQFLKDNPRYHGALQTLQQTGDPAAFIRAVHRAGYATDPAWSDKILNIAQGVAPYVGQAQQTLSQSAPAARPAAQPTPQPSRIGMIKGGISVQDAMAADQGRSAQYALGYASDPSGVTYAGDEPLGGSPPPDPMAGPSVPYGVADNVEPGDFSLPGRPLEPAIPTAPPSQPSDAVEPPSSEAPASLGDSTQDPWQRVGQALGDAISQAIRPLLPSKEGMQQASQDLRNRQATLPGTPQADALAQQPLPFDRFGSEVVKKYDLKGLVAEYQDAIRRGDGLAAQTVIRTAQARLLQLAPTVQNEILQTAFGGDYGRVFENPLGKRETPVLGPIGQALGVEEGARFGVGDVIGTFGAGVLEPAQWAGIIGTAIDPSLSPQERGVAAAIPLAGPALRLGVIAVKKAGGALSDAVAGFEQRLGRPLTEPEVTGITREWESGTYLSVPETSGAGSGSRATGPAMGIVSRETAQDAAQQYDRYYHGTGADYRRYDSSRAGEMGGETYGGSMFLTNNVDEADAYARMAADPNGIAGANIRAVDVPKNVRLLDSSKAASPELIQTVQNVLEEVANPNERSSVSASFNAALTSARKSAMSDYAAGYRKMSDISELDLYRAVEDTIGFNIEGKMPWPDKLFARIGFDGIAEQGHVIDGSRNIAIFETSLDKIRNATAGTPGGLLPGETPQLGSATRIAGQAAGSGVGAAYQESQNPESTPASIAQAGLGAAATSLGNAALSRTMGVKNAARVARAASEATDRMRNSGSPELERLGTMMDTPPAKPPTGPQVANPFERVRRAVSQRLTDSDTTMNDLQKDIARASGTDLPIEERISTLRRLNPDSATDMQIQREIMQPLRDAGEQRDYADAILTLKQNVDQADAVQQRVTEESLKTRVPVAGVKAAERAQSNLDAAQKTLDDVLAREPSAAGPEHTAYGKLVDQQLHAVERQAQRVERIRSAQEMQRLDVASLAFDKSQAELDRLRALRGTADEPAPALYARMITAAEQAVDIASRRLDSVQESFANRMGQREAEAAQASLERAQRVRDRVARIQTADRERVLRNADRAVTVAQDRLQRARDRMDEGITKRIDWAKAKGQEAGDNRLFSGGLTRADSEKALEDLKNVLSPEEYAKAEQLAAQIVEFNRGTLDIAVQGGLVHPDLAAELYAKYPNYSPTNITKYASTDGPNGVPVGRTMGLNDNGLRRITVEGTSAAKQSPIEASVAARYDMMRRVHRNAVTGQFLEVAKASPELQQHVREIISMEQFQKQGKILQPGQTLDVDRLAHGQGRIGWFDRNAVKHEYLVDDWALPLIQGSNVGEMNAYQKFLQEWRSAVTDRSISFTERNAPRDAWQLFNTMIVRQGGPSIGNVRQVIQLMADGYRDAFRGVREGTFHGSTADYLSWGGGFAQASGRGLEQQAQRVDDIARTGGIQIKNPLDFYRWATDPLAELNRRLELAPRSAIFKQAQTQGQSNISAVIAARDFMPYEVAGDWLKMWNRNVPFLSARMAGTMSQARLAAKYPKTYLPTVMATTVAPAIAIEMYNRMDPDRSKAYDDVPPYLKYMGNVMMLPWAGKDLYGMQLPNYLFLPTGVVSPFSILGHAVGAAIMGKGAQPADYAEMFDAITQTMAPVDTAAGSALSQALGPVVSTGVELAMNRDLFRGNDIATKQSDIEASRLGQSVAGSVNAVVQKLPVVGPSMQLRPSQVDHLVKGLGGNPASIVVGASDLGRQRPGEAQNIQDLPVIGGLISPLIGNRTGGVLSQERNRTMSGEAGRFIRDQGLSWTPNAVDDHIGKVPLTRAERGEVQRETNALFNEYVVNVRQWVPDWDSYEKTAKEQMLKNMYTNATKVAESNLMERYPSRFTLPEQNRRVDIEIEKKAG